MSVFHSTQRVTNSERTELEIKIRTLLNTLGVRLNYAYLNNDQLDVFYQGLLDEPRVMRVSGIAGAGKSEIIKLWIQVREQMGNSVTNVIAPTAVAAEMIGGKTVDSFFGGWRFVTENTNRASRAKAENWSVNRFIFEFVRRSEPPDADDDSNKNLTIVDEADMCSGSHLLTILTRCHGKVIFVGDHNQLLPVLNFKGINLCMLQKKFEFPMYRLDVIVRTDSPFLKTLCQFLRFAIENKCGLNCLCPADQLTLRDWSKNRSSDLFFERPNPKVYVCFTNNENNVNNNNELKKLRGREFSFPVVCENQEFVKETTQEVTLHSAGRFMTVLTIKEGAVIMFTRNTTLFKNGTTGVIENIKEEDDGSVRVINIRLVNGAIIPVDRFMYDVEYKKRTVKVFQFPFMLAYSLTTYKMQAKTCDYPILLKCHKRLKMRDLYVFVSRSKKSENIYFSSPLSKNNFSGIFSAKHGACNHVLKLQRYENSVV